MDYANAVKKFTSKELVSLYNRYTPGAAPVRKFTDKATAFARVAKVLEESNVTLEHVLENPEISQSTKDKLQSTGAEPSTDAKPAKAAKEPKAKKEPKVKKEKAPKIPGPRGRFAGKDIVIVVKDNPYRPGSSRDVSFKKMQEALASTGDSQMSYDTFQRKVGRTTDLRFGLEKGHFELVEPLTSA